LEDVLVLGRGWGYGLVWGEGGRWGVDGMGL